MNKVALMMTVTALALGGCHATPTEADYGRSVRLLTTNQVWDHSTLLTPSVAPVEGGDPDMLNLGVTTMRTQATDRKDVAKPIVLSIGGQSSE